MLPNGCPNWQYSSHPDRADLLRVATEKLLAGINAGHYPVDIHARDTRPIHKQLFLEIAPPSHEYYAGTYRGSHQRCLRNYNVQILGDNLVGTLAPKVFEEITRFGSAIAKAVEAIDRALASAVPAIAAGQSVALIIKALAAKVELDPARYAGHSLRSGFLTSAAHNRASIFKMADQSRHKSLDVLREYVRSEERFDDHAADGLLRSKIRPRRS